MHIFNINCKDGIKLWINDDLILDSWEDQKSKEHQFSYDFKSGNLYNIKMEHYEKSESGNYQEFKIRWSVDSPLNKIILPESLYPKVSLDLFENLFILFDKIAFLINESQLTKEEISYITKNKDLFDDFDINLIPIKRELSNNGEIDRNAILLTKQWLRIFDIFEFKDKLKLSEYTFADLLNSSDLSDFKTKLSDITSWKIENINSLIDYFNLNIKNFATEKWLIIFHKCMKLISKLRINISAASELAFKEPNFSLSENLILEIRSKYENEQWLKVSRGINNLLREMQRNALIEYLIPRMRKYNVKNSSHLYEFFLLDVENNSCVVTSRIRNAISTVQIFINRCLMNLEPEIKPSAIDTNTWKWFQNYRLWEAGRMVFIFCPWYMRPELRHDKTELFKDFQNDVLQSDTDIDQIEKAFHNYLNKFNNISNLSVCGFYWEKNYNFHGKEDDVDVLHVIAKTNNNPITYYYRKLLNGVKWTPWEKVNIPFTNNDDIKGTVHITPIVFNKKLYVFWLQFLVTPNPKQTIPGDKPENIHHNIYASLCSSVYDQKNREWQDPKIYSSKLFLYRSENTESFYNDIITKAVINKNEKYHTINIDVFRQFVFPSGQNTTNDGFYKIGTFIVYGPDSVYWSSYSHTSRYTPFLQPRTFNHNDNSVRYLIRGDIFYHDTSRFRLPMYRSNRSSTGLTIYADEDRLLSVPIFKKLEYVKICYPHQFSQFTLSAPYPHKIQPFFIHDRYKSFFVIPSEEKNTTSNTFTFNNDLLLRFKDLSTPIITNTFLNSKNHNILNNKKINDYVDLLESRDLGVSLENNTSNNTNNSPSGPIIEDSGSLIYPTKVKIMNFYAPFIQHFTARLFGTGIEGLLSLDTQRQTRHYFEDDYGELTESVQSFYPPYEKVDFTTNGSYSKYYEELFLHCPLYVAKYLSDNHKFELAQKWYHYVFNPLSNKDESTPSKYWNYKPFKSNCDDSLVEFFKILNYTGEDYNKLKDKEEYEEIIAEWKDDPFNPYLIAELRPIESKKYVVLNYIDNLIKWGDFLFTQNTREKIEESRLKYLYALSLLGPKPQIIKQNNKNIKNYTYNDLHIKGLDKFSNALVDLENQSIFTNKIVEPRTNITFYYNTNSTISNLTHSDNINQSTLPSAVGKTFYFCIPQDDQLLKYWDIVNDRLFKIRNCMNIHGIKQQLSLFDPPIDPMLLVKARASGADIGNILNNLNTVNLAYKFEYVLSKSKDFCSFLISLGSSLLNALNTKDVEQLNRLRSDHEIILLKELNEIKQRNVDMISKQKESLLLSKDLVDIRLSHYVDLIGGDEIDGDKTDLEKNDISHKRDSSKSTRSGGILSGIGTGLGVIPDIQLGTSSMGPHIVNVLRLGHILQTALAVPAGALQTDSNISSIFSQMSSVSGSFERRKQEWEFQKELAEKEKEKIEKDLATIDIQEEISRMEVSQTELQIQQSTEINDFLSKKFTNVELYEWQVSQISSLYLTSFKIAHDLAKKAENVYRFETGNNDTNFIQLNYWDSLKKGLLSGEQLLLSLQQMEKSFMEQDRRQYEITKQISLRQDFPYAFISLKETGKCLLHIPETYFDKDYPGHIMRRLKAVSASIPCVVGPYTSINCTLTLLGSKIRKDATSQTEYAEQINDSRFVYQQGIVQSIATSTGNNDYGLFQLNFNDVKYLPFEGYGGISEWLIDLPMETNQFDFNTISDFILTFHYTAKEGGQVLKQQALESLQIPKEIIQDPTPSSKQQLPQQENLVRIFSMKHEFSNQFHSFLNPNNNDEDQKLELDLSQIHFPFQYRSRNISINKILFLLKFKDDILVNKYREEGAPLTMNLFLPDTSTSEFVLQSSSSFMYGIPNSLVEINNSDLGKFVVSANTNNVEQIFEELRIEINKIVNNDRQIIIQTVEYVIIQLLCSRQVCDLNIFMGNRFSKCIIYQ